MRLVEDLAAHVSCLGLVVDSRVVCVIIANQP